MNDKRTFMSSLSTRKSLKIIGYSKADMKRNDIPESITMKFNFEMKYTFL